MNLPRDDLLSSTTFSMRQSTFFAKESFYDLHGSLSQFESSQTLMRSSTITGLIWEGSLQLPVERKGDRYNEH
jgi:hypothetical protein